MTTELHNDDLQQILNFVEGLNQLTCETGFDISGGTIFFDGASCAKLGDYGDEGYAVMLP